MLVAVLYVTTNWIPDSFGNLEVRVNRLWRIVITSVKSVNAFGLYEDFTRRDNVLGSEYLA